MALDKLQGMNFKGFNTTGSREMCQFAGNCPTVHSQKEEGIDRKLRELHGHFHHLYSPVYVQSQTFFNWLLITC